MTSSCPSSTSARPSRGCSSACRPATSRSSSTTARPTARARWPAALGARVVARAAAGLRRGLLRRPARGPRPTSSASWTATRRFDPRDLPPVADPVAAGDADLVLGARRGRTRLAPRAGVANRALAFELRRRMRRAADRSRPDARRAAASRCSPSGCATGASAGRSRWWCAPRPPAGTSARSPVAYLPRARALEGDGHGPRHAARGPRHGGGARMIRPARGRMTRVGPALLVIAKAPVAGRVKTRLTPPCTPAAGGAARRRRAERHARRGRARAPRRHGACSSSTALPAPGCRAASTVVPQRGDGLAARLAAAFEDAGGPAFLVGMDTPQVTPALLDAGLGALDSADAALRRGARRRLLGHRAAPRRSRGVPRRADERRRTGAVQRAPARRARPAHRGCCRRCATSTRSPTPAPSPRAAPATAASRRPSRRSRSPHDPDRKGGRPPSAAGLTASGVARAADASPPRGSDRGAVAPVSRSATCSTAGCWRPRRSRRSAAGRRRRRGCGRPTARLEPLAARPLARRPLDAADAGGRWRSPRRRCSTSAAARAATSRRCARRRQARPRRRPVPRRGRSSPAGAAAPRSPATCSARPWRRALADGAAAGRQHRHRRRARSLLLRRTRELLAPGGDRARRARPAGRADASGRGSGSRPPAWSASGSRGRASASTASGRSPARRARARRHRGRGRTLVRGPAEVMSAPQRTRRGGRRPRPDRSGRGSGARRCAGRG